jgi:integrase
LSTTVHLKAKTRVADTGLRGGELGALRAGGIDFLRRRVEVIEAVSEVNGRLVFGPTKTYQNRSVPLPRFSCDELVRLLAGRGQEDFVFPGSEVGALRHRNFYACHFKPAVRQAGLPDFLRFHDLRHSFAGSLIAEGAHPRAMMERMGHSSITVTLITYGHLLPGLE